MTSRFEMDVATRTLLQEARSEPPVGQFAVAMVIVNRLRDGRWGKSLAEVCLWRAAFSGWYSPRGNPPVKDANFAYACNLRDDDPALTNARTVIQSALDATTDPTGGANHYYAPAAMVPPGKVPDWVTANPGTDMPAMRFCGKFGSQLFYSDRAEGALTS